jgi:hypothetical protein
VTKVYVTGKCVLYILTVSYLFEEVLHRVKEERNILQTIKRRNVDWVGHILHRKCLLKHVIKGNIEGRI